MALQDPSWFKPLFHLEKKGLKKIHQIKHMCCLFDRREYELTEAQFIKGT